MFSKRSIFYVIFFLSGATGLVYEVIWVRLTGLVFGNTSHAIATVLGAFMAGLALGSWKLGQRADRTTNPLRLYGLLEIGIGVSAALVRTGKGRVTEELLGDAAVPAYDDLRQLAHAILTGES